MWRATPHDRQVGAALPADWTRPAGAHARSMGCGGRKRQHCRPPNVERRRGGRGQQQGPPACIGGTARSRTSRTRSSRPPSAGAASCTKSTRERMRRRPSASPDLPHVRRPGRSAPVRAAWTRRVSPLRSRCPHRLCGHVVALITAGQATGRALDAREGRSTTAHGDSRVQRSVPATGSLQVLTSAGDCLPTQHRERAAKVMDTTTG